MKINVHFSVLVATMIIFLTAGVNARAFDVDTFVSNFENKNDQTVLVGQIDSLTIIRGNAEFHLGKGELTILDFGGGKPCAMVFKGKVHFIYSPPDEIEHYQLMKFTGKDTIDCKFDDITFLYTVDIDNFPNTTTFSSKNLSGDMWYDLRDIRNASEDHLGIYLANNLIGDLLNDGPGSFLYADFKMTKFDHLAFIDDPTRDDRYTLCKLVRKSGHASCDVWCGYSDDNSLPSQRGLMAIDIKHYVIDSRIERGDKMLVKCRISYTPMQMGKLYLPFFWYKKNQPLLAMSSDGDTLKIVHKKDSPGFGVVLKEPMSIGEDDYIDIEYQGETLIKAWGYFFNMAQTYWYPRNIFRDKATFELSFKCSEDFQAVASATLVDSQTKDGFNITRWRQDVPVVIATFELGLYNNDVFLELGIPPVNIFYSKSMTRKEQLGNSAHDIVLSLKYFSTLFGPCPFDTLKVAEFPGYHGLGAPGLLHLTDITTWSDYSPNKGSFEQFRSHEVAHQWWYHIVGVESYRDTWIIEGLAEYCGYAFYQSAFKNTEICKNILWNWRLNVNPPGPGESIGSEAGPVVMGRRLNSSKSKDYSVIVYDKSAYIFHMIRYLFHDYKSDSDDAFLAFLRDLLDRYKDKPITTSGLQEVVEAHAQTDMDWFFDQWVYGIHIPTYRFSYDTEKTADGQFQVTCHVKQEDVPDGFKMIVPLTVVFDDGQFAHMQYWIDQPQMDIELPPLPIKPKKIDFNTYDAVLARVID
ncbi:MAG: M1 family metallopeptidase [candidate division Zixibacteria bacterium]|nr:M1 family metallopeptidase [candidate division Zixibacteria bacterium]